MRTNGECFLFLSLSNFFMQVNILMLALFKLEIRIFMFVPCINSITFLLVKTDAHNYKIIGILKQLKFRLSLRHVSVHAGTIIRELFRA
jgi:hypothetical protein